MPPPAQMSMSALRSDPTLTCPLHKISAMQATPRARPPRTACRVPVSSTRRSVRVANQLPFPFPDMYHHGGRTTHTTGPLFHLTSKTRSTPGRGTLLRWIPGPAQRGEGACVCVCVCVCVCTPHAPPCCPLLPEQPGTSLAHCPLVPGRPRKPLGPGGAPVDQAPSCACPLLCAAPSEGSSAL